MATWDPQHETMGRARPEELQLERLRSMLARVHDKVPFYRSALDAAGFAPGDLTGLTDPTRLPFTEKDDFRDSYPYGLFAVPFDDVVEIHSSSGTTGKAVVGGYTRADLETWTDFGTTILIAMPPYALYIGEVLEKHEVEPEKLKLRLGMFGAETCSEEMRRRIEERLPMRATDEVLAVMSRVSSRRRPVLASQTYYQDVGRTRASVRRGAPGPGGRDTYRPTARAPASRRRPVSRSTWKVLSLRVFRSPGPTIGPLPPGADRTRV